ncbi:unnamed protein product [Didymodactylos carnosus]|uniref:Uncharacterized protein n=1 Tax=Didymodactylos carnosus TaxID=1234261 RepID=A0A814PPY4_9BILA|nr:unnamed protein product [Didymodactylos carnosus]CAF1109069.1 unnamed protein product [Didymodactylos carnosus]CAF3681600.1 unnamed protein product [Didymodactylos carnosus]CAF3873552.1 unnamed protein product [Didymodactylos carnosus]
MTSSESNPDPESKPQSLRSKSEESNSSTALHAASYYGNYEIVRLLLSRGVIRSILNKYQCTPYDEAANDGIIELFHRPAGGQYCFGGNETARIQCMKVDPKILARASTKRSDLKAAWFNMKDIEGWERIEFWYQKAKEENNPIYLVQAYTAGTGYYFRLNTHLASEHFADDLKKTNTKSNGYKSRHWILNIVMSHPLLDDYNFKGKTYRGMQISDEGLEQYAVGSYRIFR